MLPEIGSTFWEIPVFNNSPRTGLWWENNSFYKQFFKSGRNAIKALCRLLCKTNKTVVVPFYTCETVVSPFKDEGWNVYFYPVNKNLTINGEALWEIIEAKHPDVLYVHSYFGFNTLKESENLLRQIQSRGVIIAEDITQSFLSDNYLDFADYYVTSLRKFYAIPEGGVLFSRNKFAEFPTACPDPLISETAMNAYELKKAYFESPIPDPESKIKFRQLYEKLNSLIGINSELQDMGKTAFTIFENEDFESIRKRRTENSYILNEVLSDTDFLQPIFGNPKCGEIPLYLPVYVTKTSRSDLQKYFAVNDVYCPVIWYKSGLIDENNQIADSMYDKMLCFPIDQRYGNDEMEKIISLIRSYKI